MHEDGFGADTKIWIGRDMTFPRKLQMREQHHFIARERRRRKRS
jgi:hypothetical protein